MTTAAHNALYDDLSNKATAAERLKVYQHGPWNSIASLVNQFATSTDVIDPVMIIRQLNECTESSQFLLTCFVRREALIDELQSKLDAVIKTCARCATQIETVLKEMNAGSGSPEGSLRALADSTPPALDTGTGSPANDSLQLSQSLQARPSTRHHGVLRNAAAVLKSVASTNAEWIVLRSDATTMTTASKTAERMTSTVDLEKMRIARLVSSEVQVAPEPFRAEIARVAGDKLAKLRRLHWQRAFYRLQFSQAFVAPETTNPATASRMVVLRYSRYAQVVKQQIDLINSVLQSEVHRFKDRGTHYVDVVEEYVARRDRLAKRSDEALLMTNAFIFSSLKCVQLKRTEPKNIVQDVVARFQSAAAEAEARRTAELAGVALPAMSTLPAPLDVLYNKDDSAWLLAELPATMKLALKHWQQSVKRLKTRKPHLFVHTLDGGITTSTPRSPSPRSAAGETDDDGDDGQQGSPDGEAQGSPTGKALPRSHRYDHVPPRVFEGVSFEVRSRRQPKWDSAVPTSNNKWASVAVSPPAKRSPRSLGASSKVAQLILPPSDDSAPPFARPMTSVEMVAQSPIRLPAVPTAAAAVVSLPAKGGASLTARDRAAPTMSGTMPTKPTLPLCPACEARGGSRPCGRPDCRNGTTINGRRIRPLPQQHPRTFFVTPSRAGDLDLALGPGDTTLPS